jgi:uncharacterized protein YjdB
MHILSVEPAKPETTKRVAPAGAAHGRRRGGQFFALFTLLALSVAAVLPMSSMASDLAGGKKKIATTIKLKASPTTVAAGQTLTLTADVLPAKATGTVTAYYSYTATGPFEAIESIPVTKGVAKGSQTIPSAFAETEPVWFKVVYNGSSKYASSKSKAVKVNIEK